MTFPVLLAVLAAALLHATWNAILKVGVSKQTSMFILSVGHAAIGIAVAATHPVPGGRGLALADRLGADPHGLPVVPGLCL